MAKKKVKWESPSNIALIKYWGKNGDQLPNNPSLSFTLSDAKTTTELIYQKKKGSKFIKSFTIDGQEDEAFQNRIEEYFTKVADEFHFLNDLEFEIISENTFPHSSGIASSASGFSALALCICTLAKENGLLTEENFYTGASHIARLGSGSASRSVFPKLAMWGKTHLSPRSKNEYAIKLSKNIDPLFLKYHDSILVINGKKKKVSSSVGHGLMDGHPFAQARYSQAKENLENILYAMKRGDEFEFMKIVESEAMMIHALMLSSDPFFFLLNEQTLKIIERLKAYRNFNKIPVAFTLDAGPNIHILYPDRVSKMVKQFIDSQLVPLTEGSFVIHDRVGTGPKQLDV